MDKLSIKKTGRTFSIVTPDDEVVEGGFFSRAAADDALKEFKRDLLAD